MAFGGVLPLHSKRNGPCALRRIFRSREKVLIFLVGLTFLFICIGPIFFLPELRGGLSTRVDHVYKVYKQIQKAGPELILPPPPPQSGEEEGGGAIRKHEGVYHNVVGHNDIHLADDKQRLLDKINNDEEMRHLRVIEKPVVLTLSSTSTAKAVVAQLDENVRVEQGGGAGQDRHGRLEKGHLPVVQGGEDPDPVARQRRDKVKEVSVPKLCVCVCCLSVLC